MENSQHAARLRAKAAALLAKAERVESAPSPQARVKLGALVEVLSEMLGEDATTLRNVWKVLREGGFKQASFNPENGTYARGGAAFVSIDDAARLLIAMLASSTVMGAAEALRRTYQAKADRLGPLADITGDDDAATFGGAVGAILSGMARGHLVSDVFSCVIIVNQTLMTGRILMGLDGQAEAVLFGPDEPALTDRQVFSEVTDKTLRSVASLFAAAD